LSKGLFILPKHQKVSKGKLVNIEFVFVVGYGFTYIEIARNQFQFELGSCQSSGHIHLLIIFLVCTKDLLFVFFFLFDSYTSIRGPTVGSKIDELVQILIQILAI
jgi:hypothetical protein